MTINFIKIFPAILVCVFAISAQTKLPIVTETKAITSLRQFLPSSRNKKPVLINFWATWCGPCKVEFPALVKVDADYRAKGLDFVLVSIDNLGAMDSIVADFLKSYESTMPSYLLDATSRRQITKAIRQIAPTAQDGFPLTLLFDTNGKVIYQKNGVIDSNLLRTKIDNVLAKITN